jgi:hypothetical protein
MSALGGPAQEALEPLPVLRVPLLEVVLAVAGAEERVVFEVRGRGRSDMVLRT